MRQWRDALTERLRNDSAEAEAYLQAALEEYQNDQNKEAFLLAIRTLVDARGGFNWLSKETHLNRSQLYRTFSEHGNPTIGTLTKVLTTLGFKLGVQMEGPKRSAQMVH